MAPSQQCQSTKGKHVGCDVLLVQTYLLKWPIVRSCWMLNPRTQANLSGLRSRFFMAQMPILLP